MELPLTDQAAADAVTKKPKRSSHWSTRRLIAAVAVVLVLRAYTYHCEVSGLTSWYFYDASWVHYVVFSVVSFISAYVVTWFSGRYYSPAVAWLFGVAFGTAAALPLVGYVGAIAGRVAAAMQLVLRGKELVAVQFLGTDFVPALLVGTIAGNVAHGWYFSRTSPSRLSFVLSVVGVVLAFLFALVVVRIVRSFVMKRAREDRSVIRWAWWSVSLLFLFLFFAGGVVIGIQQDLHVRYRQLRQSGVAFQDRPVSWQWLWKGPHSVSWLRASESMQLRNLMPWADEVTDVVQFPETIPAEQSPYLGWFRSLDTARLTAAVSSSMLDSLPANQLQTLEIHSLDANAFQSLRRHRNLTELTIGETQASDAEFASLQNLKWLEWLHIEQCPQITSNGLSHLTRLPLISLQLDDFTLDSAGVLQISKIASLERIDATLDNQDVDLAPLANLAKLDMLFLKSNQLSTDQVAAIASIPALQAVYLSGAKLTDDNVVPLLNRTNLYLDLDASLLTENMIRQLHQRHPTARFTVCQRRIGSEFAKLIAQTNADVAFFDCQLSEDAFAIWQESELHWKLLSHGLTGPDGQRLWSRGGSDAGYDD